MIGIGTAGKQIDVIVRAPRLAWINAGWGIVARRRTARRCLAASRLTDEHAAAVMHHRILHRRLQTPSFAGLGPLIEGADDAEREQHAGARVADRRSRLDRLAARLAGDAHCTAAGLRYRIKAEPAFIWAAGPEAFDLGIDDARIESADDVVAEP